MSDKKNTDKKKQADSREKQPPAVTNDKAAGRSKSPKSEENDKDMGEDEHPEEKEEEGTNEQGDEE